MLGKKHEIRGSVEERAVGSEFTPFCTSSNFHFVYQLWTSLPSEERFGRSTEYISPTSNTTLETVDISSVTKTDGTR